MSRDGQGNRGHWDWVYDHRKRLLNEHRMRGNSVLHFEASDEWDQYRRCGVNRDKPQAA